MWFVHYHEIGIPYEYGFTHSVKNYTPEYWTPMCNESSWMIPVPNPWCQNG